MIRMLKVLTAFFIFFTPLTVLAHDHASVKIVQKADVAAALGDKEAYVKALAEIYGEPITSFLQTFPNESRGAILEPKEVVLTFDDGPHKVLTPLIAQLLVDSDIPAAFFELGSLVKEYPALTISLAQHGFIIGNHTYDHKLMTKLTDEAIIDEIFSTQMIISDVLGGPSELDLLFRMFFQPFFNVKRTVWAPEFFRAPYGIRNTRTMSWITSTLVGKSYVDDAIVVNKLFHVLWMIDSLDWQDKNPLTIEKRVFDQLKMYGKGVMLFHDIHPQTLVALQNILPRLQNEGYKVISLYDLLAREQGQKNLQ